MTTNLRYLSDNDLRQMYTNPETSKQDKRDIAHELRNRGINPKHA